MSKSWTKWPSQSEWSNVEWMDLESDWWPAFPDETSEHHLVPKGGKNFNKCIWSERRASLKHPHTHTHVRCATSDQIGTTHLTGVSSEVKQARSATSKQAWPKVKALRTSLEVFRDYMTPRAILLLFLQLKPLETFPEKHFHLQFF